MCVGLTQFDLSKEELERLQNRKWTLSSSTTRIHPSHSEPILMPSRRGRGMGGEAGGGREEGSETTMRDAFQLLSLTISSTRPPLKRTCEGNNGDKLFITKSFYGNIIYRLV